MNTSTHYENANFLRELAESLPHIRPQGHSQGQADLLQRLADEELAQAQHDEWIRSKVATARADNRPTFSTEEVMARLGARYDRVSGAPR
jgi:hypothetical protein